LTWQHNWPSSSSASARRYDAREHVLAGFVDDLDAADAELGARVTVELLEEVVALVPDAWLVPEPDLAAPHALRRAHLDILAARLADRTTWLPDLALAVTTEVG